MNDQAVAGYLLPFVWQLYWLCTVEAVDNGERCPRESRGCKQ